ncbi:MAG: aromatic amino acid transaminase, partial [Gammaproteobacteria bacterium]
LGVGVYKTEDGATPIPAAIAAAMERSAATQQTKVYVGQAGNERFNRVMLELALGADHVAVKDGRAAALQAPGGCGALRLGAELVNIARPEATLHLSTPTWANHVPLMANAGLKIAEYPYFDRATGGVDVAAMLAYLERLPAGDLVLLHGCCHNPTGADLAPADWDAVAEVLLRRGLVPFVDIAYQGLGDGLEADAYGARLMAAKLPEVVMAVSCSKNFGLYRERTGATFVISPSVERTGIAMGQLRKIARGMYSMPPDHGAELVALVWEDAVLRRQWIDELEAMRLRVEALRSLLVEGLKALRPEVDYSFVQRQKGMFSLLPLDGARIQRLRDEHHLYMPGDGRINVAGISRRNVGYVAQSLAAVI